MKAADLADLLKTYLAEYAAASSQAEREYLADAIVETSENLRDATKQAP